MKTAFDKLNEVSSEMAKGIDLIVTANAPVPIFANIKDFSREIHPDDIEIWKYKNKPFLELHPLQTRWENNQFIAERKYRKL